MGSNKRKRVQFGGDANDSDAEEISLGSKDTSGWSEQSFATSSVAEDSEVEVTPPKIIKAASRPSGILKAPTTLSPTENLAKMVKESMTFKSPQAQEQGKQQGYKWWCLLSTHFIRVERFSEESNGDPRDPLTFSNKQG